VGDSVEVSSPLQRLATIGAVDMETEEQRLRRSTLVLSIFLVCVLTPLWIVTYFALGLPVPASIPLAYLRCRSRRSCGSRGPSGTPHSGPSSCR
jgi:hypothetical protein